MCAWRMRWVARLRPALAAIGLTLRVDPPQWFGESALWVGTGSAPVLSLVGFGPAYHTPGDRPDATTSPELLERVYDAVSSGLRVVLR